MKAGIYREMSTDELEHKVQELERHLFDLRSQATTEKLQDCRSVVNARREIARIKTVLRQRVLAAADSTGSTSSPRARSPQAEKTGAGKK